MKIMFVCTGNICRSPILEGILKEMTTVKGLNWQVESSGIESYHKDEKPDYRAIKVSSENGVDISSIRSKQITMEDVKNFDFIFGVTTKHVEKLKKVTPIEFHNKIKLILEFTKTENKGSVEISDPYYGTIEDFSEVFKVCKKCCENLIAKFT